MLPWMYEDQIVNACLYVQCLVTWYATHYITDMTKT